MIERVRPSSSSSPSSQSRVRGRPFEHGNSGRPPGSKNKTTRMLELLVEGEGEDITRKFIDLAKAGNVPCLQSCVDRLMPKRHGRPLDVQLPKISGAHDIVPAMTAIINRVNNGDLTPEEGSHLIDFLERCGRLVMANDLVVRVEKVEAQMKQMKTFDR